MGRDGAYRTTEPGKRHFNPRARVGRDIPSARRLSIMRYFNPRARVGRDRGIGATCQGHGHFNPRARVGRDNTPNKSGRDSPISIHAPAWGATLFFSGTVSMRSISIHAPAWGATPVGRYAAHLRGYFNPRARVGRDGACLHGLNYSGCAIFFANLIFGRAVTGIFRRKILCVIRVRTEILRPFSRRRCLLQHQSSFSFITWFCTNVLCFSCVFIA